MKKITFFMRWMKGKYFLGFLVLVSIVISQQLRVIMQLIPQHLIDVVLSANGAESTLPNYILWFVDVKDPKEAILKVVVLLIIIQLIRAVSIYFMQIGKRHFGESVGYKLRNAFYEKLQSLPYSYHKKVETGDLIQRCTTDIQTVRVFVTGKMFDIFRIIFLLVVSILGMSSINLELALWSIILTPVIFGLAIYYFGIEKKISTEIEHKEGLMNNTIQENLTGSRVVKAFAREEYEMEKFEKTSNDFMQASHKRMKYVALYWSASDLLVYLQLSLTLLVGGIFVMEGSLGIGELASMYLLTRMVIFPIRELGRIVSEMSRTFVSASRLQEIFDMESEYELDGELKPKIKGNIEFKNVSFSFDDEPDKHAIKNVSFKVESGETIAIVGRTGSGKSTLINLLIRLTEVNSGEILYDGISLKDIGKNHLRKNIGVILQEPFLFAKTVEKNIAISNSNASIDDVAQIAKVACVHNDIKGFNEGYDTLVGERGVTLSGGQKQRIAIARMLIDPKPILVFDDSLSAVDNETDASIRKTLKEEWNETTMIIITHRITTAMKADKIIVLSDDGTLESVGKHKDLVEKEGLYKKLWDIQTGRKRGDQ